MCELLAMVVMAQPAAAAVHRSARTQALPWAPEAVYGYARRTEMDGVHRLCRDRDIPPLDGRAKPRCERAEGRRDTAVALCDSGEEGLRYLLFFKSG